MTQAASQAIADAQNLYEAAHDPDTTPDRQRWDDVELPALSTVTDLKASFTALKAYIDDDKPSEAEDAIEHMKATQKTIDLAEGSAKQHYTDAGGKVIDFPTLADAKISSNTLRGR